MTSSKRQFTSSFKNRSSTLDSLWSCGNVITACAIPASSEHTVLTILETYDREIETVSAITDWKLPSAKKRRVVSSCSMSGIVLYLSVFPVKFIKLIMNKMVHVLNLNLSKTSISDKTSRGLALSLGYRRRACLLALLLDLCRYRRK